MNFPDPKPNDYITTNLFRVIYDFIKRGIAVVPPLILTENGAIGLSEEAGFWIQITGDPVSGSYPWKQVHPAPGGTWIDGARAGTASVDPAREINGSTATLTGKRAKAWRDNTSGMILFAYGSCP